CKNSMGFSMVIMLTARSARGCQACIRYSRPNHGRSPRSNEPEAINRGQVRTFELLASRRKEVAGGISA
ncbi:MAG: hypothetical protein NUK65_10330, partial [Firmicutes bacterium]|nr:hypothetical protein [Bacillota bacterium]